MSGLVSQVDYYCFWACTCAHAYTAHVNVHETWCSKQIIIFQLNEVELLLNLVWLSRRFQGYTIKKSDVISACMQIVNAMRMNMHAHFYIC